LNFPKNPLTLFHSKSCQYWDIYFYNSRYLQVCCVVLLSLELKFLYSLDSNLYLALFTIMEETKHTISIKLGTFPCWVKIWRQWKQGSLWVRCCSMLQMVSGSKSRWS
jgi:hypothetical protein